MSRVQGRNNKPTGRAAKQAVVADDEMEEHEQCVICAERMEYAALAPCTHSTCHKCTFRQRALYDKKACLVCRTESDKLIFTDKLEVDYADINKSDIVSTNPKFGISFTSKKAEKDTMELLAFRCQVCNDLFSDMKVLSAHIRDVHEKYLCSICSENKKAFPCELKVYTHKQLQTHQMRGDEKGFTGHPMCKFCKGKRFYSEDELKLHLRQSHEKCHVCDQIDPSSPQFFKNYEALEEHFKNDHFSCRFQSCLDQKFVVYADELDLQAHNLSVHGGVMGKTATFGSSSNSLGNNGRYQLSTFRSSQATTNSSSGPSSSHSNSSEQADSYEMKRMRFEERAKHYLNYSSGEMRSFKHINSEYRNGELSAAGMKNRYQELFHKNTEDEIYLLLFDFSKLFTLGSDQQIELSKFVEEHENRATHEANFPALPGSQTSLSSYSSSWNNSNGGKNNKKSNGRQTFNQSFPALPASSAQPYKPAKPTVKYTTLTRNKKPATVRVDSTPSTYVPNYLSNSASSSSSSRASSSAKVNTQDFPALPTPPPKKTYPVRNLANKAKAVEQPAAWGSSSISSASTLNTDSLEDLLPVGSKGKGKKKKQVLFTMGGR